MQPDLASQRVAANLRAELARQRRSQRELAEAIGLPLSGVARRLTGRTPFDVGQVVAAADFLGVSVTVLMTVPDVSAEAVA